MKLIRASKSLSLVLITLASPMVMAEDNDAGWYIGASIGQSSTEIDNDGITNGLAAGGFTTTSLTNDDSDTGYKLLGGYQFNESFALEGGYVDLGSFGFQATTSPAGTLTGEIKVKGINLDLVGTMPLSEKFSVLGRVGAFYAEAKDSFRGTGAITVANPNPSKKDTNYKFGVGLQYAFTDALALRTELERYRISDAVGDTGDIDLISVGLTYRFGTKQKPAPARKVAKVEEKVVVLAAEPKPEEKVKEVVAKHKVVVLAFEDVHFDYNRSILTKEAQKILKSNMTILKDNPGARIRIAGYTSAAGTKEYNQDLSVRRAQAVKDYLVKEGIPLNRLSIIGYGERRPARYEAAPEEVYSRAAKANMRVLFEITIK